MVGRFSNDEDDRSVDMVLFLACMNELPSGLQYRAQLSDQAEEHLC